MKSSSVEKAACERAVWPQGRYEQKANAQARESRRAGSTCEAAGARARQLGLRESARVGAFRLSLTVTSRNFFCSPIGEQGGKRVNPFPTLFRYTGIGSGTPPASAPETPPGWTSQSYGTRTVVCDYTLKIRDTVQSYYTYTTSIYLVIFLPPHMLSANFYPGGSDPPKG